MTLQSAGYATSPRSTSEGLSSKLRVSSSLWETEDLTGLVASAKDIFFCGSINEKPTIMARHHWGNIPVISFKSEAFSSDGWPPQKRCQEIAKRLDEFYEKGWLKYLTKENLPIEKEGKKIKVPVICIAAKDRPHLSLPREEVGLLMTLTHKDDGDAIIATLQEISNNPAQGAVVH